MIKRFQYGYGVEVSGPPDVAPEVFDELCDRYPASHEGVATPTRREKRKAAAIAAGRPLKKTGWKTGPRGRRMKDGVELMVEDEINALDGDGKLAYHKAWYCHVTQKILTLEPGDLGWGD